MAQLTGQELTAYSAPKKAVVAGMLLLLYNMSRSLCLAIPDCLPNRIQLGRLESAVHSQGTVNVALTAETLTAESNI